MKYDFTTLLNRQGHDALALDVLPIKDVEVDPNFSRIPMWVADMNYPVFENIQRHMINLVMPKVCATANHNADQPEMVASSKKKH